jgi:hypothetical protein
VIGRPSRSERFSIVQGENARKNLGFVGVKGCVPACRGQRNPRPARAPPTPRRPGLRSLPLRLAWNMAYRCGLLAAHQPKNTVAPADSETVATRRASHWATSNNSGSTAHNPATMAKQPQAIQACRSYHVASRGILALQGGLLARAGAFDQCPDSPADCHGQVRPAVEDKGQVRVEGAGFRRRFWQGAYNGAGRFARSVAR